MGPSLIYTMIAAVWAVLHSLIHGFHIAALNGVQDVVVCSMEEKGGSGVWTRWGLRSCIGVTNEQFGIIVTVFTLGAVLGALSADRATRSLGRFGVLKAAEIGMMLGSAGVGFANAMWMMIAARLLIGLSSGFILVTIPLTLESLAPERFRKLFGTFHQIFIGLGLITAQSLSIPFAEPWKWRIVLCIGSGIAAFLLLSGFFIRPQDNESRDGGREDDEERPLLQSRDQRVDNHHNDLSVKELFSQPEPSILRGVFVVAVAQVSQQACGISPVMYFSTHILTGLFSSSAKFMALAVMIIGIPFNFLPGLLPDWIPTKRILLVSSLGTSLFALLLGIALNTHTQVLAGVSVIGFVVAFSIGLAPLAWVVLPEVMPKNARTATGSIAVSVGWMMNFVAGSSFLPLQQVLKHGDEGEGNVFFVFASTSLISSILIFVSWTLYERAQEAKRLDEDDE